MAKTLFKVVREGQTAGFEVLETSGALTVKLDGTQILAERQAHVADATGTADASAVVNNVLAALRVHGLLATA